MAFLRPVSWVAVAAASALAVSACSGEYPADEAGAGELNQSIRNGIPLDEEGNAALFGVVSILTGQSVPGAPDEIQPRFGSGALLARNWVLTAGHVVDKARYRASQMRVRLGDQNHPNAQERSVAAVYLHPKHVVGGGSRIGSTDVDVALLRLSSSFPAETTTHDLSLGSTNSFLNQTVDCLGYGRTQDASTVAGSLHFADNFPIVSVSPQSLRINQVNHPTFGSQLPLKGDSGGPCLSADLKIVGVISNSDVPQGDVLAFLTNVAAFRTWAFDTMTACSAQVPGSDSFCSAACPCPYGYGDCENNAECSNGNTCDKEVGAGFGTTPTTDVCAPASCANRTGPAEFRGADYCTPACPCGAGGGDCEIAGDCQDGLACAKDFGPVFKMSPTTDVCVPIACELNTPGAVGFCSPFCRCGHGGGDCQTNADCMPGLVCGQNIGLAYNMTRTTDVCVPAACASRVPFASGSCTPACPCPFGGGDCNVDADCMPGLECGDNNGPDFGQAVGVDICDRP